jgi:4-amino-4-deoxy-L-arabinose transferase-like glycosyltransferase
MVEKSQQKFPIGQHILCFLIGVIVLLQMIDATKILQFPPHSAHSWRQADCASLALNTWQDGFAFAPRVHNVIEGDGRTCAEFPFFYYATALFYPVFGDADWIMRSLMLGFWLIGLWSLSRLIWHLSESRWLALGLVWWLFCSPILLFYGINYLPNVPTLGLVFTAWLCFFYFYRSNEKKWLWAFQLIFLLAAVIKPTILVSWAAIFIVFTVKNRRILGGDFLGRSC